MCARRRILEGLLRLRIRHRFEDDTDGADDVKVDDCAPRGALCAERLWDVREHSRIDSGSNETRRTFGVFMSWKSAGEEWLERECTDCDEDAGLTLERRRLA